MFGLHYGCPGNRGSSSDYTVVGMAMEPPVRTTLHCPLNGGCIGDRSSGIVFREKERIVRITCGPMEDE